MCAGIVWGCSDAAVDVPVDEVETSEAETFLKKGVDALFNDPLPSGWTEELVEELFASEELARTDSLRKDVIDRIDAALDRGVEDEELAEAFKDALNGTSNADSTVGEYLFQSDANADEFSEEVLAAQYALTTAYPLLINDDLDDIVDPDLDGLEASGSGACEITDETIDDFFVNFDAINDHENSSNLAEVSLGPCNSRWSYIKWNVCIVGSGATFIIAGGPAGAIILGTGLAYWLCTCTFCRIAAMC